MFSKACTVVEYQHLIYFWNRWQGAHMGTWALLLWIWKCWTGGPKTLPSPLRLSLTHFHSSSNNKLTCALRYRADERAVLFFNRQKSTKLWPWYVLLDTTLWNNILKKRSSPPPPQWDCSMKRLVSKSLFLWARVYLVLKLIFSGYVWLPLQSYWHMFRFAF